MLQACHGFSFEKEPFFSYKFRAMITNPVSRLWVVAYTKRVLRICAAVLMPVYEEYQLWYVTPDALALAGELGVRMFVALGS